MFLLTLSISYRACHAQSAIWCFCACSMKPVSLAQWLSGYKCKCLNYINCMCLHTHVIRSWKVPWLFPYTYYYFFLHPVITITVWFAFTTTLKRSLPFFFFFNFTFFFSLAGSRGRCPLWQVQVWYVRSLCQKPTWLQQLLLLWPDYPVQRGKGADPRVGE